MSTASPSSTQPSSTQPSRPGWFDDPDDPHRLRWFDGVVWSPFTKARPAAAAVPRPRAAPAAVDASVDEAHQASVHPARTISTSVPAAPAHPTMAVPMAATSSPAPLASSSAWRPTTSAGGSAGFPGTALLLPPVPTRGPTPLRRLAGHLVGRLPERLPDVLADPLRAGLSAYAARTDRLRDRLTAENLRELVHPHGSAWQASVAACLGVLTFLLSLWPLVGLAAWGLTCAFAGWALLLVRRDAVGGASHAWFGVVCGVGPLCTGLLLLAYR